MSLFAKPDFKAGFKTISDDDYRADKSAVNSSSLKLMNKSPLAFYNSFYGEPRPATKSMKFGTIAHLAILKGESFLKRYVVMPEFESRTVNGKLSESKNTKFYKDQVSAWQLSLAADSVIITQSELDKLIGIINAIKNHKQASELLALGEPELVGHWVDETGIACKMQADFVSFNLGALVDVKTTTDCHWSSFQRSVEKFDYPFQIAMYNEGIKQITGKSTKGAFWIAVENEAPYDVAVYQVDDIYLQVGHYQFKKAMQDLKDCLHSGTFRGLQAEGIAQVSEPSFHYKEKNKHLLGDI